MTTVLENLQGGTGKHIDGDVAHPIAERPFQSMVILSDAHPSGEDGSLHILPGFHAVAAPYFGAVGSAPRGGFYPLKSDRHGDIMDDALWRVARRIPAKWAAGALFGVALVVGATLVLHVAAYATEPSALVEELGGTLKAAGALALLTLFYSSLCTFWGAVAPEAAGIISALYLAVIEFLFGLLPGYFRCISMNYLGQQLAGLEKGGLMAESAPDVPMMIGASVIAMMAILFLGFAAMVVQISEYRFNRA